MKPRPSGEIKALALLNGRLAGSYRTTLNLSTGGPTAVLIEDGRIARLGDDGTIRGLVGRRGRAIDVEGAVIAPGIVDAHMHAFDCALALRRVSCLPPAVDSLTGLKQRLADRAGSLPAGAWVVATGYDDTRLREKRHPSRLDVDAAVPHHPAVVGRVCGHMSVANTLALASAGIDAATPDPPGGTIVRDPAGAPTGLLLETAQDLVWRVTPPLSGPDIRHALSQIGRQILGYGITTICEALLGAFHPLEVDIWEHCTLPAPESLRKIRQLGVVPVLQPSFLFAEGEAYLARLGHRRCERTYPLRAMIDQGLRPALSSDAPCTSWDDPINPWLGIATAVARETWAGSVLGTSEMVSVGEAMFCYTANGARALGLENELGAIATGKDADLIVLPRDPFTGEDPVRLAALRPTAVIVKGKVVHGAFA
jgi:predicted amidohydrolase YtcJ